MHCLTWSESTSWILNRALGLSRENSRTRSRNSIRIWLIGSWSIAVSRPSQKLLSPSLTTSLYRRLKPRASRNQLWSAWSGKVTQRRIWTMWAFRRAARITTDLARIQTCSQLCQLWHLNSTTWSQIRVFQARRQSMEPCISISTHTIWRLSQPIRGQGYTAWIRSHRLNETTWNRCRSQVRKNFTIFPRSRSRRQNRQILIFWTGHLLMEEPWFRSVQVRCCRPTRKM